MCARVTYDTSRERTMAADMELRGTERLFSLAHRASRWRRAQYTKSLHMPPHKRVPVFFSPACTSNSRGIFVISLEPRPFERVDYFSRNVRTYFVFLPNQQLD